MKGNSDSNIRVNSIDNSQISFKSGIVNVNHVKFHKNEDGTDKIVTLADGRVSKLGYITFSTDVVYNYETSLYGIEAFREKKTRDSSISYISNIIVSADTTAESIMADLRKHAPELRIIERRGLTLNLDANELRAIAMGKIEREKCAIKRLIRKPRADELDPNSYMSVTIGGVAYPVYRDTVMGTPESLAEYTTDFSEGANARFDYYETDVLTFMRGDIALEFTLDYLLYYISKNY